MKPWFRHDELPAAQATQEGPVDVIVIGAGHNGLVCAGYLARAGLQVLLLEARDVVGGAAVTHEFARDFRISRCAHVVQGLHPRLTRDLKLGRHGLRYVTRDMKAVAPDGEGRALRLGGDVWRSQASIQRLSEVDAAAFPDVAERLNQLSEAMAALLVGAPPDLRLSSTCLDPAWLSFLKPLRRLGFDGERQFLRCLTTASGDWLDETFESDLLKGLLAAESVLGIKAGPRWPGTMLNLLYRFAARAGRHGEAFAVPQGGVGALSQALAAAARGFGANIRTSARVAAVEVANGHAKGVVLAEGRRIAADVVVSSLDASTTLLSLVGERHLDCGVARRLKNTRIDGAAAKINLALDGLPSFIGLEAEDLGERILLCPSIEYAERAAAPVKQGEFPQDPLMEIVIPTIHDLSLAPLGQHTLSATVQFVPYEIAGGWPARKDEFVERVIETLSFFAPDLKEKIIAGEVLTPPEIEAEFGLPRGDWHHGHLALDQFAMLRAVPGSAAHETPLPGLYLCGAGTHPGGGLTGIAGMNAADTVLAAARTTVRAAK